MDDGNYRALDNRDRNSVDATPRAGSQVGYRRQLSSLVIITRG
jgi:hypothetical protein